MKSRTTSSLFSTMLVGMLAVCTSDACAAQSVTLGLSRHAYCRGESIPLTVNTADPVQAGTIDVFLNEIKLVSDAYSESISIPSRLKWSGCDARATIGS